MIPQMVGSLASLMDRISCGANLNNTFSQSSAGKRAQCDAIEGATGMTIGGRGHWSGGVSTADS